MKNKFTLLAALALGGLVATSQFTRAEDAPKPEGKPPGEAQGNAPGGPRGDMKDRGAKLAEELGLSDDQKAKVQEAMKEQGEQRKAISSDTALSKEDKQAKMKALRESMTEKMKTILTAEQFAKWEKMPRGPGGPRGPRGEGKPPGEKPADAPKKD
jgi:Spy/CpxP family protein refolding chaperone